MSDYSQVIKSINEQLVGNKFNTVLEYSDGIKFKLNDKIVSIGHSIATNSQVIELDIPEEFLQDEVVNKVTVDRENDKIVIRFYSSTSKSTLYILRSEDGQLGVTVSIELSLFKVVKGFITNILQLSALNCIAAGLLYALWNYVLVPSLKFNTLGYMHMLIATSLSSLLVEILVKLGLFAPNETK